MEVILLEDTRHLGKRGEVVKVKPGFARNFLLPNGVALEANKGNLAYFEQQRRKIDAAHAKKLEEAQEQANAISEINITIRKRVGDRDTLYGSVTANDIVDALAERGVTVEKRQLDLGAPTLKTVGDHTVKIDLHADVDAQVVVSIAPAE